MTSFFIAEGEEEERETSDSGRGESGFSRVYYKQHIRSSCSWCAGERVSKSSGKIVKLRAYGSDKDRALPREKLKSSAERLRGPLRLSGVRRIITQSSSHQEGPTTVPV